MKKILLIDDRTSRQQQFAEEINLNFDDYQNIIDNCIDEKYNTIYEQFQNDNYDLSNYEVIISHENAFGDNQNVILSKLEKYCKTNNISLVLFSGGIDTSSYQEDGEYKFLKINSKILYSENFKLFLKEFENNKKEILILSYGHKWKLNILLNIFEKINYFIAKNDEELIYFEDFEDECKIKLLDPLNLNIYTIEEDMEVHLSEIVKLRDNILERIKELADE